MVDWNHDVSKDQTGHSHALSGTGLACKGSPQIAMRRLGSVHIPVTLVVSTEASGIDRYAQEMAKRLPVSTISTGRYKSIQQTIWLAKQFAFLKQPVHLPNQHFGRWVPWLSCPSIVTVHDLVRLAFPFAKEGWISAMGLALDRAGLRKAAHVICVSEVTKRDLMCHLDVPEEKITVVLHGVDHEVFNPCPNQDSSTSRSPYLLYVGSERPRKNLGTLLRAFALVKQQGHPFNSLTLLKVGPAGRSDAFRKATLDEAGRLGIERDIQFVEYVSDQELAVLYSNALALVFPSLYEGFGLPIVEAMACGCPVITSNVSSMPEIAGSAALLVNPHDTPALAEAMRCVILDPTQRARLRAQGLLRAQDFSWDKTAEATFAVYQRVFGRLETQVTSSHG